VIARTRDRNHFKVDRGRGCGRRCGTVGHPEHHGHGPQIRHPIVAILKGEPAAAPTGIDAHTHHPSPITHHPSPITHHPSPITHTVGLINCAPPLWRINDPCMSQHVHAHVPASPSVWRSSARRPVADGAATRRGLIGSSERQISPQLRRGRGREGERREGSTNAARTWTGAHHPATKPPPPGKT
jgi:hypothetical protein